MREWEGGAAGLPPAARDGRGFLSGGHFDIFCVRPLVFLLTFLPAGV